MGEDHVPVTLASSLIAWDASSAPRYLNTNDPSSLPAFRSTIPCALYGRLAITAFRSATNAFRGMFAERFVNAKLKVYGRKVYMNLAANYCVKG